MKAYKTFKNWCSIKRSYNSENVLLAYLQNYADGKKSSTLWTHYSVFKQIVFETKY